MGLPTRSEGSSSDNSGADAANQNDRKKENEPFKMKLAIPA
jgi:hypothetical protein